MTRRWAAVMVGIMTVSMWAAPAAAQERMKYGVRAGVSAEPEQFFFGGHFETRPLLERLTFKPSVEIGVGDGATLVALNLEFAYRIPIEQQPFALYIGAGPAANIYSLNGDTPGAGGDGVHGGFNFFVGLQHDKGLSIELKVGAVDSPSLKFMVGYSFK
jgi:hypothetical protein